VLDGRLVLHHRLEKEEIVEAMNARDGRLIWRFGYPSSFVDPFGYNNGPRCTPLLTMNRCYTFGAEGKLLCLDVLTGARVWERDTARDWDVPEAFFGVGSTPLLDDDKLFVMIGGMPDSGIVALDPITGRTLWESVGRRTWEGRPKIGWPGEPLVTWALEHHQASYASPIMARIQGRRHLLCLTRQGLVSLDPADGGVNFAYWFRAPINESVNAMTPVVMNDLILISSAYYRSGSVLLRVGPDGNSVEPLRRDKSLEIHWSTPILHEGYLYAFSGRNEPDARFRCVNLLSGEVAWDRDESWRRHSTRQPDTYGRGSAIAADGKLIVLGEGGLLGLFRIDPERPEELSRWQVPQLEYPCWAAPVLANKRLYLRSESRLLCLDLARPGARERETISDGLNQGSNRP
jgi:outer membrane protein assembly factor BamB